jgi:hypothetical protein
VILCIRAKERIAQPRGGYLGKSKIRQEGIGWDVACDKDLIFEMTAAFLLTPERIGVPTTLKLPDELIRAFPAEAQLDEKTGEIIKKWSTSGGASGQSDKTLIDSARAEARKGYVAINAFWKAQKDVAGAQDLLRPVMGELKRIATEADKVDDDIPFDKDNDAEGEAHAAKAAADAEAALAGKSKD